MDRDTAHLRSLVTDLPIAVPTAGRDADGEHIWSRLELLDEEDARFYLGYLVAGVLRDLHETHAWHAYMDQRWGHAPTLPQWGDPTAALLWITPEDYDAYGRIEAALDAG